MKLAWLVWREPEEEELSEDDVLEEVTPLEIFTETILIPERESPEIVFIEPYRNEYFKIVPIVYAEIEQ